MTKVIYYISYIYHIFGENLEERNLGMDKT
jgi:hypothetical protein